MFIYYSYVDNVLAFIRGRLSEYDIITITKQPMHDEFGNYVRWRVECKMEDIPSIREED